MRAPALDKEGEESARAHVSIDGLSRVHDHPRLDTVNHFTWESSERQGAHEERCAPSRALASYRDHDSIQIG
ncbi:hypothetical protein WME94_10370 [Sorangium sp. So ce429]